MPRPPSKESFVTVFGSTFLEGFFDNGSADGVQAALSGYFSIFAEDDGGGGSNVNVGCLAHGSEKVFIRHTASEVGARTLFHDVVK